MRFGANWWVLTGTLAGLFLLKPGDADIEAGLRDLLMGKIAAARADNPQDPLRHLIPMGCTGDDEACYRIARNMTVVNREDLKLIVMVRTLGPPGQRTCIGAVKLLFCPGVLVN